MHICILLLIYTIISNTIIDNKNHWYFISFSI